MSRCCVTHLRVVASPTVTKVGLVPATVSDSITNFTENEEGNDVPFLEGPRKEADNARVGTATFTGATVNLMNCAVGAGVLALRKC